jgi:hypothetical protein
MRILKGYIYLRQQSSKTDVRRCAKNGNQNFIFYPTIWAIKESWTHNTSQSLKITASTTTLEFEKEKNGIIWFEVQSKE